MLIVSAVVGFRVGDIVGDTDFPKQFTKISCVFTRVLQISSAHCCWGGLCVRARACVCCVCGVHAWVCICVAESDSLHQKKLLKIKDQRQVVDVLVGALVQLACVYIEQTLSIVPSHEGVKQFSQSAAEFPPLLVLEISSYIQFLFADCVCHIQYTTFSYSVRVTAV